MNEIINLIVLLASVYGLFQYATKRSHSGVIFALCIFGVLLCSGNLLLAAIAGGGAYLYRRHSR